MGPTSPPSPFAFSMYGSYPQGYGHPVQGNGQPGHGPWATEPGYPTQENSTAEEQPAGQPISAPQHPVYPQYPGSLNNLFTSNLSSNLDLSRTTTNNLATISLHKPLTTSTL